MQKTVSPMRRLYWMRLAGRCLVLIAAVMLLVFHPSTFDPLFKGRFFKSFGLMHVLWLIWVLDMLAQLFPIKKKLALGSIKMFPRYFKPIREKINYNALKTHTVATAKAAYKVMVLWCALIAAIGILYFKGILGDIALFFISVIFYICDLICVLIWCPFRLLMHTRCCTTCRIFNWDHLMMFSPMLFINSFYARSLVILAALAWLVWEITCAIYPARFWEQTDGGLRCANCTDKLCTQYCQKLR